MAQDNYSLILRTRPTSSSTTPSVIETITDMASEWNRNKIYNGGADIGTFTVYGDANFLAPMWQTWLGLDILETDQGIHTWNGQICRVELYAGSVAMARDINLMYNRVRGTYVWGLEEPADVWTSWYQNTYSQHKYGIREEKVDPPTDLKADAELQVQYVLKMHGWPPRYPCANILKPGEQPNLKVYVNGYKHSLNNRVIQEDSSWWSSFFSGIGYQYEDVSVAIKDIIDNSDYVRAGRIATNNHQILLDAGIGMKGGDFLDDLLEITDTSQNLYHGWIDNERKFHYERFDNEPEYYVFNGEVYADSGATVAVAPRHIRPGIFRVMDFPVSGEDEASIFDDRRDVLIEDISIDAGGVASYKPKSSAISDYVSYMESRKRYLLMTGFLEMLGEINSGSGSGYTCTE